jgi:alcohol dehydrogenase class IV
MPRAARSLRRAYERGDDAVARQDLALASLCGGLALANAGLGAAHGFAGPVGGMFPAPHGAICAAFLPHVMTVNIRALRARQPDGETLRRYDEIARLLTGSACAEADDGVRWVRAMCSALHTPGLATYGVTPADFPVLVEKAAVASSMKANPITLTHEELREILERVL